MGVQAIQLDPSNLSYRLNVSSVLLRMRRPDDAIRVLEAALKFAKTPAETESVDTRLESARRFRDAIASRATSPENSETSRPLLKSSTEGTENPETPPVLKHRAGEAASNETEPPPAAPEKPAERGPRDMMSGTITEVKCSRPAHMDLTLKGRSATFHLHTENYYNVEYSAIGFTPEGVLEPCAGIQGRPARIYFYDWKGRPNEGELISVELRK